uniref:(northern house mosquito) hypothetical protein n=1 Tax=Culex pipiens TaxID=7175 RepID=A0A8D8ASA4_CULPI
MYHHLAQLRNTNSERDRVELKQNKVGHLDQWFCHQALKAFALGENGFDLLRHPDHHKLHEKGCCGTRAEQTKKSSVDSVSCDAVKMEPAKLAVPVVPAINGRHHQNAATDEDAFRMSLPAASRSQTC